MKKYARLMVGSVLTAILLVINKIAGVRIGFLVSSRIGHLAVNTEYWLRKNAENKKTPVFLSYSSVSNNQLLTMIARKVPVIRSNTLYAALVSAQTKWPALSIWIDMSATGTHDYQLWSKTCPQMMFTDDEKRKGDQLLRSMGVPEGNPFVCFAMRDRAYLDTVANGNTQMYRYHDYRDVNIENCHKMTEWLTSQGIWVIRMGAVVEKEFESGNPRIVDYAWNYRSDFGDIFLLAHCKYFVGDTAGLFGIAQIFGVPVALTNLVPITHLYPVAGSMVMPKKYRDSIDGRILRYREVVMRGFDGFLMSQKYDKAGLDLIENTPEEILEMVREMNERIDGTWKSSPEDEELHNRFWSIFPPGHLSHGCPARVPIGFLRLNKELIG